MRHGGRDRALDDAAVRVGRRFGWMVPQRGTSSAGHSRRFFVFFWRADGERCTAVLYFDGSLRHRLCSELFREGAASPLQGVRLLGGTGGVVSLLAFCLCFDRVHIGAGKASLSLRPWGLHGAPSRSHLVRHGAKPLSLSGDGGGERRWP